MFLQDVSTSICSTDILSSHPFDIEAALVQLVEKILMSILAVCLTQWLIVSFDTDLYGLQYDVNRLAVVSFSD